MQALQVEKKYSRRLLQRINRLQEELEIIYRVLLEQKAIILMYRASLDPQTYQPRSIPRQMKFDHESKYLDKIVKDVQRRIVDCAELVERTKSLAAQNVQLVETRQDENNNAIMVFTIVTVIFLPPSFLTSYFGMNLQGINGTKYGTGHFWVITAPVTFVFVAICLAVIFYRPVRRRWELRKDKIA
jgi:Mg2+ and Co2+ transporter CorA